MSSSNIQHNDHSLTGLKLRKLDLEQVRRIDEMLSSIGDYGEVHLIIQHGELRYINRVESHKVWKNSDNSGQT
jgi:aryl-alcohol dehydrogenase-like predicted oxidoreductase